MSDPPSELSVVIVSWQCRQLLDECLESLPGGLDGLATEVFVVDNASTDGTPEMVRTDHPWVELIESGANNGFALSTNLGLARARGQFVLLLNPDTRTPPGSLRAAVEALRARPEAGMLGVKLVRPDGSLDHAAKRGFPTPASALAYFTGLARLRPRSPRLAQYTAGHVDPDQESAVDAVNGAFMLVRREALDVVGPMEEEYWLYMEDLDWCYRFWQLGWPVVYWPGAEVVHVKWGSSTAQRSWPVNLAFHRGMWIFYRRNLRPARSWVTSAAVWLGIWLKLGLSAARAKL